MPYNGYLPSVDYYPMGENSYIRQSCDLIARTTRIERMWESGVLLAEFERRRTSEEIFINQCRALQVTEKGYTALNSWKTRPCKGNKRAKNRKCGMCRAKVKPGRLATGVWEQVICGNCEGRFFKSMRRHLQRTGKIEAFEKKKRERELAWLKVGRKRIQEMKKLLRNPETVKNPEAVTSVKMESKREKILHV
jgi:hypothetical protein